MFWVISLTFIDVKTFYNLIPLINWFRPPLPLAVSTAAIWIFFISIYYVCVAVCVQLTWKKKSVGMNENYSELDNTTLHLRNKKKAASQISLYTETDIIREIVAFKMSSN